MTGMNSSTPSSELDHSAWSAVPQPYTFRHLFSLSASSSAPNSCVDVYTLACCQPPLHFHVASMPAFLLTCICFCSRRAPVLVPTHAPAPASAPTPFLPFPRHLLLSPTQVLLVAHRPDPETRRSPLVVAHIDKGLQWARL